MRHNTPFIEYTSPLTNSVWKIWFDMNGEVEYVDLNNKNITQKAIRKEKRGRAMFYHTTRLGKLLELKFRLDVEEQIREIEFTKNSRHFGFDYAA